MSGLAAKQLGSGAGYSCAIRTDGVTLCWGDNNSGQIGDATNVNRLVPTATSLGGVTLTSLAIAPTSSSTCGIASTQDVWCWGYNGSNLGDGTRNTAFLPMSTLLQ